MEAQSKPEAAQAAIAAKIAAKPTRRFRAWIFQGYVVTAAIAFGILFVLARASSYFPLDLRITLGVQTVNAVWFYGLMWGVSVLGYSPQSFLLAGAIVLMLLIIGLRWEAVTASLAALGVSGLGALVKIIVHRPRPSPDLVHVVQRLEAYGFPSGHVLFYTAFFGFLLFLCYTLLKVSFARTSMLVILVGLVGLVGVSRIYLGAHWASDVLGAYLLGSLWLAITVYVYRWGKTRFFVRQPVAPEKPELPASHPLGTS